MREQPAIAKFKPRGRSALQVVPKPECDWRAPNMRGIVIGKDFAYMTRATWLALLAYDETMPTGVWPGKVWRCSPSRGPDKGRHFLVWYGLSDKGADYCSNNSREVLLIENKGSV